MIKVASQIMAAKMDFLIIMPEQQCLAKRKIRSLLYIECEVNTEWINQLNTGNETAHAPEADVAKAPSFNLSVGKVFLPVIRMPDPMRDE